MSTTFVQGGNGIHLFSRSWGNPQNPAIIFLHGWSGSHASWKWQYESDLAEKFYLIAVDQRGSGYSEAPSDPTAYTSGDFYAQDIKGILDAYKVKRPVLVAWSFSGLVVADYLARFGDGNIAGIVLTGSLFVTRPEGSQQMGPAAALVRDALSPDLDLQYAGLKTFLQAMGGKSMTEDELARETVVSMMTPPHVRAALLQRSVDHTTTWSALQVPALILQGDDDQVVLPATAQAFADLIPDAQLIMYKGIGHTPFREHADTVNRDLTHFVLHEASR